MIVASCSGRTRRARVTELPRDAPLGHHSRVPALEHRGEREHGCRGRPIAVEEQDGFERGS